MTHATGLACHACSKPIYEDEPSITVHAKCFKATAVNSHEALVEALTLAVEYLESLDTDEVSGGALMLRIRRSRAALALAEPEKETK